MKLTKKFTEKLDSYQQSHRGAGFLYAVLKKYGEDQASYKAALITYYAFWSIFPLLIVLTAFLQLTMNANNAFRTRVTNSVSHYLPIIGNELQSSVHSPHKTGLTFVLGVLLTLYGARGVADAARYTFNHIWQVPRQRRPSGLKAARHSLIIIVAGGAGLLLAGVLSSYATSIGHLVIFRILSILVSVVILFGVLTFVIKQGTARPLKHRALLISAATAAIGLQILQSFGGYIITHELSKLSSLYGEFALVLGLLFWIYLQTRVVLYALEIGAVYSFKLWPRSLSSRSLLAADQQAFSLYEQRDSYRRPPHA